MSDEQRKRFIERNAHTLAVGGRALTAVSILFFVPFLRRRREQRKAQRHDRFAIFGH